MTVLDREFKYMELIKIVAEGPEWVMYIDEDGDVITVMKKPKNSAPITISRRLAIATKSHIESAGCLVKRLAIMLKTKEKK